jgi:hypothetical protein
MSRRRGRDYDHVDYTKLAPTDRDNGFIDAQFITPAQKVPWKSIFFGNYATYRGFLFINIWVTCCQWPHNT